MGGSGGECKARKRRERINEPKHWNFFPALAALGVLVEYYRVPRRVEVVSVGEAADSDGNLLSLEDHGLVGVVGHAKLEVAAREAEASGPKGLQLRHFPDGGHVLRLRAVAQIARGHGSFKVAVAHDGTRVASRVAIGIDAALHICQVRAQHGHLVAREAPLVDDLRVPVAHKEAVRVHLHDKVLAAV